MPGDEGIIMTARKRCSLVAGLTIAAFIAVTPYAAAQTDKQKEELCIELQVESSNPLSDDCPSIVEGRKLYANFCSACHGAKADGIGGPSLGRYAADLRKHWSGYKGFVEVVKKGKKGRIGLMPPWEGALTDEQINQLGAYLETLAIEGAYWK